MHVDQQGARTAVVQLEWSEPPAPGASAPEVPPSGELKAVLARRFLWLTDDKRAAQWIARVDVRPPATPLEPFELTVLSVEKNSAWRPLEVSSPINRSLSENAWHPSLGLASGNAQREQSINSRTSK